MRCTRINFEGYKRLANTGCNVDGRIIAFVGLNEVGKSSLLAALVWLTADEPVPLPVASMSRSHRVNHDDPVVWAITSWRSLLMGALMAVVIWWAL